MSADAALNRLGKWRTLFAGWQLGTRPKGDPECDAVSDHREATLLLRCEVTALTDLLVRKGVITVAEWEAAVEREAADLSRVLSERFPGVTATDAGLAMNPLAVERAGWMKGWKP